MSGCLRSPIQRRNEYFILFAVYQWERLFLCSVLIFLLSLLILFRFPLFLDFSWYFKEPTLGFIDLFCFSFIFSVRTESWQGKWSWSVEQATICGGAARRGNSIGLAWAEAGAAGGPRALYRVVPWQAVWSWSDVGVGCSWVVCTCVTLTRWLKL